MRHALTKKIIMIALTHVACLPDWQTFGKCDIGKISTFFHFPNLLSG
jgi:hypothetical protein